MNLDLIFSRIPEFILGFINVAFIIQLRRITIDNLENKKKNEKIIDLTAENISLKYQYQQLLTNYNIIEGENKAYKKFHEHPMV